jgi:hypothetical protein
MFNFDFTYLTNTVLPPLFRTNRVIKLIQALKKPLELLKFDFYLFYERIKYELTFNNQVIYLEHLLNDTFDDINRDIYITDGSENPLVYVFNNSEPNEDVVLFNSSESETETYLYNLVESEIEVDFIINIPSTVTVNEDLLKSLVNTYRSASKRFSINYL